jgi:hypothetical protein
METLLWRATPDGPDGSLNAMLRRTWLIFLGVPVFRVLSYFGLTAVRVLRLLAVTDGQANNLAKSVDLF